VSKDRLSIDDHYWYYGSRALNQIDGPDAPEKTNKHWGPWNKAMVDAPQDKKDRACADGGWMDLDRRSYAYGGPLYTTAINGLTLEVYYRCGNGERMGEPLRSASNTTGREGARGAPERNHDRGRANNAGLLRRGSHAHRQV